MENKPNPFLKVTKRGKGKNKSSHGLKDFYKFYRNEYKHKKFTSKFWPKHDKYVVNYPLYATIIAEFNKRVSEEIVLNAAVFRIPAGLGYLKIQKKKMDLKFLKEERQLKIDWKRSKEHNRLVFHLNEHSDFHRFRWSWNKKSIRIPNHSPYNFKASRTNNRAISKAVKSNKSIDYHI